MDTEAIADQQDCRDLEAIVARRRASRRDMLRGLSVGTMAAVGGGIMAGCDSSNRNGNANNGSSRGTPRDIDILNFALNLEYLEAEFYTYATTGKGIETVSGIATTGQNGTGTTVNAGTTKGGVQVNFGSNSTLVTVAAQLAFDEQKHVIDLRSTITSLGGTPVAKPNINLAALAPAVDISTVNGFLLASRAFEDTGVSAYGGAARYISNPAILQASAQILAVESYHAANIRLQIAQLGLTSPATDTLDVPPPPAGASYFAIDTSNALAVIRTPRQVLNIVLAATNGTATTGGFFPNGTNANLATLTSLVG